MKRILLFVFILVLIISMFTGCSLVLHEIKKNLNSEMETKTLSVKDLSLEYNSSWAFDEPEGNKRINKDRKARLMVSFKESQIYYNSYSFAYSVYNELTDKGEYSDFTSLEPFDINGNEWYKIACSYLYEGENYRYEQYYFSKGYEFYIVTYMVPVPDIDTYENEYKDIIKSIKMDNLQQVEGAEIAKSKLVGEWDWDDAGYAVINEDDTYYIYKDSSKGSDNVIHGTYECSNKVATNAAGYEEGITLIITLVSAVADGEVRDIEPGAKVQYVFISQDEEGKIYEGKNFNSDRIFEAIKVK